jgi:chaperonin GroES
MKLIPSFNRVVLKRDEVKEGTILMPDKMKDRLTPTNGEVLACGPTCDLKGAMGSLYDPKKGVEQSIGAKVMFGSYAGYNVDIEGENFFVVNDDDIIGVMSDE